ncbi:hypothetical protein [Amycolatopsis sp. NPDC059657]|uniref:hypothetical protein n=1 Tax=Amycolatopsis sp. NPDC059657 TaxID=3346899 RepID=UPI00366B8ADB
MAERYPLGYRYLDDAGVELIVAEQLDGDRYTVRTADWQWRDAVEHAEIKRCRPVHRHSLYRIGARYRLPEVAGVFEIVEYKPNVSSPQIDYRVLNLDADHDTVEAHQYLAGRAQFLKEETERG